MVEINEGFRALLGYGPDGLPYRPPLPWWPAPDTDPADHDAVSAALAHTLSQPSGRFELPLRHRDGRRLWMDVSYTATTDPETGERLMVGTARDVTAEHLAGERELALGRLTARLSEAGTLDEVLEAGLDELGGLWRARRALAADRARAGGVVLTSDTAPVAWTDLPAPVAEAMIRVREGKPLQVTTAEPAGPARPGESGGGGGVGGVGTKLEYGDGDVVIWLEFDPVQSFGAEDRALLSLLGGYLGQALNRAHRADQQRAVALALQRSILGPADLPAGFAVRYEPAVRPLEIGGDWYDVVELGGDRIGVVVGDCVGRGLDAAAVMGQLRSACRALLLQDPSPGRTLAALDRFAALIPGAICTTVFCGVLDRGTGSLHYSTAGHPPGILAHLDGSHELLDRSRSMPLAIPGAARPEATADLRPGSVLLLYTDGLVERRGEPISISVGRATEALVAARTAPIGQLPDQMMAQLLPDGGSADDVAVLLYRHAPPDPDRLVLSFPALPTELAGGRRALRNWLATAGADPLVVNKVLTAAGEACANAIEHAYTFAPDRYVLLTAHSEGTDLHVTITDTGRWKTPDREASQHRGHGLNIIRGLMPAATVDSTDHGTTVHLRLGISHDE